MRTQRFIESYAAEVMVDGKLQSLTVTGHTIQQAKMQLAKNIAKTADTVEGVRVLSFRPAGRVEIGN